MSVKAPDSANGVEVWTALHQAFYKQKRSWVRRIPFFSVKSVSVVDVSSYQTVDNTCRGAETQIAFDCRSCLKSIVKR